MSLAFTSRASWLLASVSLAPTSSVKSAAVSDRAPVVKSSVKRGWSTVAVKAVLPGNSSTLSAPIEKPVAERVFVAVAYEKLSAWRSKWSTFRADPTIAVPSRSTDEVVNPALLISRSARVAERPASFGEVTPTDVASSVKPDGSLGLIAKSGSTTFASKTDPITRSTSPARIVRASVASV